MSAAPATEISKIEQIVHRLLDQGGREKIVAERDAAALAVRQANAREAIAAIVPERSKHASAWAHQVVKVRAAYEQFVAEAHRLQAIVEEDSSRYDAMDALRFSARLDEAIGARLPGYLNLDHLAGGLAELERAGHATIASREGFR